MPKGIGAFFIAVTFILGVSVGMFTNLDKSEIQNDEKNNVERESVQDVVLKKVQETNSKEDSGEVVQVANTKEKISPYAKIIIKKNFKKCNHITVNIIDVPKEIINLEKEELAQKYDGWTIEKFSSDEIILSRDIDANCDDHYVLREKEGIVAVYKELTKDKVNLIEETDIDFELLESGDKEKLKTGIKVYGKNELNSLIEDYNS